jgi:hypothetical protein
MFSILKDQKELLTRTSCPGGFFKIVLKKPPKQNRPFNRDGFLSTIYKETTNPIKGWSPAAQRRKSVFSSLRS